MGLGTGGGLAAFRSRLGAVGGSLGAVVRGYYSSGLPGPKGNRESFVWLAGGPGARSAIALEPMAREVEP